jgi:hypothetical protein
MRILADNWISCLIWRVMRPVMIPSIAWWNPTPIRIACCHKRNAKINSEGKSMSLAFETSVWERIISPLYKFKQGLTYHTHPTGRASLALLGELRNCHQGKRCFILGNGPSLQKTDLTRLRDEYTFGLNRIYMLFPQLGFSTTFLVTVNHLVVEFKEDNQAAIAFQYGSFPHGSLQGRLYN